ncbi:MAG: hypothetical protein IT292_08645 [Deltaproteobacteria bacterium]|nr:hypothetical protein [Deltaproteobacteria bacterium]
MLQAGERLNNENFVNLFITNADYPEKFFQEHNIDYRKSEERLVTLGKITSETKSLFWEYLGPVKRQANLKKLIHQQGNSYLNLLAKSAEESLAAGSIGLNYIE